MQPGKAREDGAARLPQFLQDQLLKLFLLACAEKTLDYCSCLANYTYVSNGTTYRSDGGCIQDDPSIPPWCIVYEKSCSQPPPKKPDGQFWDICRGAPCPQSARQPARPH